MLLAASVLIILAVGWAQFRNGISSSVAMLFAVVLAGLTAFNFWEPMADALEPYFQNGALHGCEDLIALTLIFGVTLFLLRLAMFNYLAPEMIEQHGYAQFFGAAGIGLITGYLVAGFLICAMETLPLDEHFLDFETRSATETPWRSLLPPDRVWLAMMRHAGSYPLSWKEDADNAERTSLHDRYKTFDRNGTFELRYQRYRRTTESKGVMPYQGEFDRELYGKQKNP